MKIHISYPWMHLFRHPILVLLVAYDYKLRKEGKRPDRWYKYDLRLMKKTGLRSS